MKTSLESQHERDREEQRESGRDRQRKNERENGDRERMRASKCAGEEEQPQLSGGIGQCISRREASDVHLGSTQMRDVVEIVNVIVCRVGHLQVRTEQLKG